MDVELVEHGLVLSSVEQSRFIVLFNYVGLPGLTVNPSVNGIELSFLQNVILLQLKVGDGSLLDPFFPRFSLCGDI